MMFQYVIIVTDIIYNLILWHNYGFDQFYYQLYLFS